MGYTLWENKGNIESQTTALYNGLVQLEFNPASHRYFVRDGGEEFYVPSVTTVCGVIDKPWLMQWAVKCAVEIVKGAIQPDATYPEIYLDQVWASALGGFRSVQRTALDVGTEVHEWIEQYLTNDEKPFLPHAETPVGQCCNAALKWLGENEVKPVAVERRVYSRKLRCSGTLDNLAYVKGQLAIVDWKSSKAIYPEYELQAAAYTFFYEEETGSRPKRAYIVRLGKDDGEFEVRELNRSRLAEAFKAFRAALEIYRWQKGHTR